MMSDASTEAKLMKDNILETILTQGHLPPDIIESIRTILALPARAWQENMAAHQEIAWAIHKHKLEESFALVMQYQIIERFCKIAATDVWQK
jgi:hypothetical protein